VKAGPDDLEFGEVVSLPDPELPFEEASMSFSAAGEWLVSSLSDATIAAVGADGSVRWPRESPWLRTREAAAPDAQSLEPAASSDDGWLDGRIAATADGDDLLFTAGNRLWRLEDAFV